MSLLLIRRIRRRQDQLGYRRTDSEFPPDWLKQLFIAAVGAGTATYIVHFSRAKPAA